MVKKTIIGFSILLIILVLLTFNIYNYMATVHCSNYNRIDFILDWVPNTNHTGIYVAKKLGYFKDVNLDVRIIQPPEDSSTALVGAGKAQLGISFQDSLALAFSSQTPVPVTAVSAILQHNTGGILVPKKSNVLRIKDLENKTYASWNNPIEQAMLKHSIKKCGGNFDKVNVVPYTVTDVISAFSTNIDAVYSYYGLDYISAQVKGIETNFFDFRQIEDAFDFYAPVIIANNNYMQSNPQQIRDFLLAVEKGYNYAIKYPDSAAEILLDECFELDRNITIASQRWISSKYKSDAKNWGEINETRWNKFYSWLYDKEIIKYKIPDSFGFCNDYLTKGDQGDELK